MTVKKLEDHHRFMMAVATRDVPRLSQLVKCALKEKAGVGQIVSRIEDSLSGVYQSRGYNSDDQDISLLVLWLGGRKLLYALSQHIAIPSIRTLRRAASFTKLMPSLGPVICDVLFNMKAVLSAQLAILDTHRPFRSGVTIMMDEVAGEGQACYFPHADCAGGFCREHCASVDTRLTTFDNTVNLVRRLQDGTLHYGKEVSVITIGSFGQVLHGAYPVLISPCARLSRLRGLRA